MKYMMFVYPEDGPTEEQGKAMPEAIGAWLEETERSGVRVIGSALRPVTESTTVRVRSGQLTASNGPFTKTNEEIAGFDILECADLDEAIEVARKHPIAAFGALELRPFDVDED